MANRVTGWDDTRMLGSLAAAVVILAVQAPKASPAVPQQAPAPGAAGAATPARAANVDDAPWPVRLGLRVAQLETSLPVARQVTLVPDGATWLDEISRWTREARWPVLIEDDRLTPLFIRAFKPERIVRRISVGPMPRAKAERERLMDAAVTRAWGGDPASIASLAALQQAKLMPPGIVVTSSDDDAWPAAVALAAGRGLPLCFLDGEFGGPNDTLASADFDRLDAGVRAALDSTKLAYSALGDAVDAVAICRSVAAKAHPNVPRERRIQWPASANVAASDPLATTDALCRNADGSRYAVAGWIFGPSDRAAYMAMCSLFLERGSWWFLSGYATGEPWSVYAPDEAAKLLNGGGFTAKVTTGNQMSLSNWRKLLMGGFDADVLVMNSSGDPNWFSLHGNDRGDVLDLPFLSRPSALHLIHSWSLTRPADRYSIGGRLLERGVYAYYGSVQEPFLAAFLPPLQLAQRWGGLGPFLVSSRMLEGALDGVWRLTAIGDPLMMCIVPAKRIVPVAALPEPRGDDVRVLIRDHLAKASEAGDSATGAAPHFAAAMRDLRILGQDDVAVGLWQLARSKQAAASVAADALPALFRQRSYDEFIAAYQSIAKPDDDARDMLWHLSSPRIASLPTPILELLRRNLRDPDVSIDLAVLLPGIDKAKGRAESDRIVSEELERTSNKGVKAKLGPLLRR